MTTSSSFTVACPSCSTEFPIDPGKVPAEGVPAVCATCLRVFPVARPSGYDPPEETAPVPPPEPAGADPTLDPEADLDSGPDPSVSESDTDGEVRGKGEEEDEDSEGVEPDPPEEEWSPFEDLSSLATEVALGAGEEDDDEQSPSSPSSLSKGHERFGRRDVHERARHLARVLVSDIIAYHPTRYQESLARGTLKDDFEAEVQKSWKEYVDQVGPQMAESTPYFNEALNEVLAKGEEVF